MSPSVSTVDPVVDRALVLEHVATQYPKRIPNAYAKLYSDAEPVLREAFASLQERLNGLFMFVNNKIAVNGHFNADPSRSLLDLIEEIRDLRTMLHRVGIDIRPR